MFDHLGIRNFKSVEHVALDCRRVNVLIGEPNTGKSNILEALGLISYVGHFNDSTDLHAFVRCEEVSNLFYDGDLSRKISVILAGTEAPLGNEDASPRWYHLQLQFSEGSFSGGIDDLIPTRRRFSNKIDWDMEQDYLISGDYQSLQAHQSDHTRRTVDFCKLYRFAPRSIFPEKAGSFLLHHRARTYCPF